MQATPRFQPAVKKVCVIGPECTGKTDLSQHLAAHYKTNWVPEYARGFLNKLNRPYVLGDLVQIAHGQMRLEQEWLYEANRVLICDTNLITIKIWSEYKFGQYPEEIARQHAASTYDLYLLTYIDVPWEDDPQREHPDKRDHFWQIYKKEVEQSGVPVVEIGGDRDQRRAKAIAAVDTLLAAVVPS
jgi:NadR type nicotinamide-nucleotide adenylyltransferase